MFRLFIFFCPVALFGQCVFDFDGNGEVEVGDLRIWNPSWGKDLGQPGYLPQHDVDDNGRIELLDAVFLVEAMGSFCLAGPMLEGCPLQPPDNIWNTRIDTQAVDPNSLNYLASMGLGGTIHPDFGSGLWSGGPIGIPFISVPGDQPLVEISFTYESESDPGPYPIPEDVPIEGGPNGTGDRHLIIVDRDNCLLYEVFYAWPQPDGTWEAGSGAVFDLESNVLRPDGWTSADAAGLPILPGLVRYDEVESGEIRHALRFTANPTQRAYIWPARHFASNSTNPDHPPMGLRLRLRDDFDISSFTPRLQIILTCLKRYGMILADNGSNWFLSGVPDERWDNDELRDLDLISGADFEVVDSSSLIVDPNSGQTTEQR